MKFPQDYLKLINVTSSCYGYWRYIGKPSLTDWSLDNTIHLLHAGEGNMKIYSPKSIIFPEGNPRVSYSLRSTPEGNMILVGE